MTERVERVKTSLEIEEDLNLHIKGWILQRAGWGFMLLILISAVLGLFGNGILSENVIIKEGSSVLFERFTRRNNEAEMEIISQHSSGIIEVCLSPRFTESFKVENIIPEPKDQMVKNGLTVYEFA